MLNNKLNIFFIISVALHLIVAIAFSEYLYRYNTGNEIRPILIEFQITKPEKETSKKKDDINEKGTSIVKKELTASPDKTVTKKTLTEKKQPEQIKSEPDAEVKTTDNRQEIEPAFTKKTSATSKQRIINAYPNYKVNPKPDYPLVARRRGYEGEVLVSVRVLKNGKVGETKLEKPSGHEVLDNSALDAVKRWEFIPGKRNGQPVSSWVTIPIKFRLRNG